MVVSSRFERDPLVFQTNVHTKQHLLTIFGGNEQIRTVDLCLMRASLLPTELHYHLYLVWVTGIEPAMDFRLPLGPKPSALPV